VTPPVLEARQVDRRYPGVQALAAVSLDLRPGEIHALVGENGAGKSTLIKILTGVERPDGGELFLDGESAAFGSPAAALEAGVAAIFQELALVQWLSVAENIQLGRASSRAGIVSYRRMREAARAVLRDLDVAIDPAARVSSLSAAERQLVEIARALSGSARILVMDEPTSSLPGADAKRLLEIMARLRDRGAAILFVSHRLEEVLAVADRITVLRGGVVVETLDAGSATSERLIELMVGTSLTELFPAHRGREPGPVALSVRSLTSPGRFEDVSFDVCAGEIVGFAGLIGAGRTEVMRAVCGIEPAQSGTVEIEGQPAQLDSPRQAIAQRIVYVPEDRKQAGLVLTLSGFENVALPTLRRFERRLLVRTGRLRAAVGDLAARCGVRGRLDRPARTLSGGNQQKLVLAKWILAGARVLVLDEPTRGIDIGAKREIYHLIAELCDEGLAVVLVSSELPELLHLTDRIVVMSGGRVCDELGYEEFDEQRILRAAFSAHTVTHLEDAA
jgi:ABC-type sugar transport system ATPase subunit